MHTTIRVIKDMERLGLEVESFKIDKRMEFAWETWLKNEKIWRKKHKKQQHMNVVFAPPTDMAMHVFILLSCAASLSMQFSDAS